MTKINVETAEELKTEASEEIKEEQTEENVEAEETTEEAATEEPAETTETKEEDEELAAKYMRLMADFQNFKKRTEKQKSDIHAFANEKIVSKLVEVVDNFERALDAPCENEGYKEGMSLIFKHLMDVLTDAGVKEIEAVNVEFDPNFHNAVMMEDTDEVESGHVSAVLQKGYTLNGKVIRPSMVKVAN